MFFLDLFMSEEKIKVVILGASNVGKTCLIHRWISGTFSAQQTQTIGSAYFSQFFPYDGKNYEINVWDTAGQEQFHSLTPVYCQNSRADLLVFDITNRKSFDELHTYIELAQGSDEPPPYLFVGNKLDLNEQRAVTFEEASTYARDHSASYIEVSACSGQGVDEMFDELCLQAINSYLSSRRHSSDTITVNFTQENPKTRRCC